MSEFRLSKESSRRPLVVRVSLAQPSEHMASQREHIDDAPQRDDDHTTQDDDDNCCCSENKRRALAKANNHTHHQRLAADVEHTRRQDELAHADPLSDARLFGLIDHHAAPLHQIGAAAAFASPPLPRARAKSQHQPQPQPGSQPQPRTRDRVYTLEEVAKHCHRHDCWLVAHGRVYDVTEFIASHPAGEHAILRHAGTDSTVDFDFHSHGARSQWRRLEIGRLEGAGSGCVLS